MKFFFCMFFSVHLCWLMLLAAYAGSRQSPGWVKKLPKVAVLASVPEPLTQNTNPSDTVTLGLRSDSSHNTVANFESLRQEQIGQLAQVKTSMPTANKAASQPFWIPHTSLKYRLPDSPTKTVEAFALGLIYMEPLGILFRDRVLILNPWMITFEWIFILLGVLSLPWHRIGIRFKLEPSPLKRLQKAIRSNDEAQIKLMLSQATSSHLMRESLKPKEQLLLLKALFGMQNLVEAAAFGAFLLNRYPDDRKLLKLYFDEITNLNQSAPLHLSKFLMKYFELWPSKERAVKVYEHSFFGTNSWQTDDNASQLEKKLRAMGGLKPQTAE